MDIQKAKAVVALAKENAVHEGPIPTGDDAIIARATEIIELAIEAYNKNVRGDEVTSLLMLDANWDDMSSDEQSAAAAKADEAAETPSDGGTKSNPFAKGAAAQAEAPAEPDPEPDPEPEPEPDSSGASGERVPPTAEEIEQAKSTITELARDGDPDDEDYYDPEGDAPPFDEYDKMKVAEFKKAFSDEWDAFQIAVVQLYEENHKGRPGIVNWTPAKAGQGTKKADEQPASSGADEGSSNPLASSTTTTRTQDAPNVGGDYDDLLADVKAKHDTERLSLPEPLPEDRVVFPLDIRQISGEQLRHLHWSANAYAARCAYVLSLEQRLATACTQLADDKEDAIVASASISKENTATVVKAQAAQDEEVKLWRKRARKHQAIADDFRKQREIYQGHVEALSRQHTMRSEEK